MNEAKIAEVTRIISLMTTEEQEALKAWLEQFKDRPPPVEKGGEPCS